MGDQMMKRTGIALAVVIAIGNLMATFILFRVSQLMRHALAVPLETNPPTTVLFVQCWWWPAIVAVIATAALGIRSLRTNSEVMVRLCAGVLLVETCLLIVEIPALTVPLAQPGITLRETKETPNNASERISVRADAN